MITYFLNEVEDDTYYDYSICAVNQFGKACTQQKRLCKKVLDFSMTYSHACISDTTDVQSVCGFLEENVVTILCSFAEGSAAQGCMVTLITDTTNTTKSILRDSQSGSATGSITASTSVITKGYHFYAQDIEADGSVGSTQLPGNLSMEQAVCSISQYSSGESSWQIANAG